jgi:hypothetical protein
LNPIPEDDDSASRRDEDEIPRPGILSTIPKRTFTRVALLLTLLAGIIYLRQQTGSIASCMASSFSLPLPAEHAKTSAPLKAHVVLPGEPVKEAR